jgi:hypothetical protein
MSAGRGVVGTFVVLTAIAGVARGQSTGGDPAAPAAPETEVVQTEAIHAVVLPMKGSYMQHPQAFERLGSFLAGQGVTPTAPPFARYFSDPSVGEANLEWEVGFPGPADLTAEAPFEIKDIPATLAPTRTSVRPGRSSWSGSWPTATSRSARRSRASEATSPRRSSRCGCRCRSRSRSH